METSNFMYHKIEISFLLKFSFIEVSELINIELFAARFLSHAIAIHSTMSFQATLIFPLIFCLTLSLSTTDSISISWIFIFVSFLYPRLSRIIDNSSAPHKSTENFIIFTVNIPLNFIFVRLRLLLHRVGRCT